MKKIIVPTDLSDTATNAVRYAHQLATQMGAELEIINIFYPTPVVANEVTYIDPEIEKIKRTQFQKYIEQYQAAHGDEGATVKARFQLGFPADEIVSISESEPDIMIVMGSTGDSGALKKIFGSVSTKVVRSSKCPVVVVPPDVTFRPLQKLMYCADDLFLDAVAIGGIVALAKPSGATIELIHVKEKNEVFDAKDLMEVWTKFYTPSKVTYTQLVGDNATDTINAYATENNADMVCMTTEDRGFWGELFHSSLTRRMAITSDIPLYVAHIKEMDVLKS